MTLALVLLVHLGVAVSTVLLLVAVRQLRARGSDSAIHDAMEAAFLGGGPGRVADAAIAGMHADGRLTVGGPGIVAVQRAVAHHPVEQLVLQEHAAAPSGALHTLRLAVMRGWAVQQVGDVLAARGLLVAPAECRTVRKWGVIQAAVCFLSLPVALVLSIVAVAVADGPRGGSGALAFSVLPILFVGGLFGSTCASAARHRVTHGGRRALLNFQAGVPYGASLPTGQPSLTQPPVAQLVAAHGLAGIPDPLLREQLRVAARMRPGRDYVPAPHTAAATVAWCSGAEPGSGTGCGGAGSGCGVASCGGGGASGGGSGCGGSSGSSSCGGGGGGGSSCGGGGGGS
ncbi:TIGR04222 domain-containing membrane protein [Streptomyces sp. NPDC088116]|uniref:TIGR04222 domain-containing membrane protein n=1 Tax=Streptomyces sp. NPDC088116 TaxID=3365825 RepID=UPI003827663D